MMDASGEGGLALGLELKYFERIGDPFDTREQAENQVILLCGETVIAPTSDGKFIVWFRNWARK